MLVSIVIVNWNRKKDTQECLKSLVEIIKDFDVEIIIVDNASTDDSVKKIKRFLKSTSFKKSKIHCELIKNDENLGFCGGNNVGIRHALNHKADYVLLLNNDTYVDKYFLVRLVKAFKKYPKAGILSPKIYFAPGFEFKKNVYKKNDLGKVIWYAGGDTDWDNVYGTNHGVDEVDKGQFDKAKNIDFATGACMLIKREVFEKVGLLDEKYFMYFEDNDLCMRAKKTGWKVMYIPQAFLWHKVAQSSGIGSELNDYFTTRNRLLFGGRYASMRTRFALYKESLRLFKSGRKWQKKGVIDFYLGRFGRGSWR